MELVTEMPWIWPESYFEETESAWISAHKFGHLNCMGGSRLCATLLDAPWRNCSSLLFDRIGRERNGGSRPEASKDTLRAYTTTEVFRAECGGIAEGTLRYCLSCLRSWFHATVFQLSAMDVCPIHREPLRSGCWNCGAFWAYEFDRVEFKHPLHCHRCGQPFAGRAPRFAELFATWNPAFAVLREIQTEIRSFCASSDLRASMPERHPLAVGWSGAVCAGDLQARAGIGREVNTLAMHVGQGGTRYDLEDFRAAARQARSVGRHLQRLDEECRRHPTGKQRWERSALSGRRLFLLIPSNGCLSCWALTLWRFQFMALFGSLHDPAEYTALVNRPRTEVDRSLGFPLSDAAQVALASFAWCVAAVVAMADDVNRFGAIEAMAFHGSEGVEVFGSEPLVRSVVVNSEARRHLCCVAPSRALDELTRIGSRQTSAWVPERTCTRWGETLFKEVFRARDYVGHGISIDNTAA